MMSVTLAAQAPGTARPRQQRRVARAALAPPPLNGQTNGASPDKAASHTNGVSLPATPKATATPGRCESVIGQTPLLDLSALSRNPKVKIFAKAEFLNPSGSIKDRIAQHIITSAERDGKLKPGGTVVASTSGNTGSAIAMMCAMRGYKYIVITNEKCSEEKRESMRAYGGEVIVAQAGLPADHPEHYVNLEATLCERNASYFGVDQYENQDNPAAYYLSLGPEIWEQTGGAVTHFVAGGSTGGTVSGTGGYLKDVSNGAVRVLLPDPVGSVLLGAFHNKEKAASEEGVLAAANYALEGVGKDSVPGALNFDAVDAVVSVTDKQAFDMCLRMSETEGVLAGGSSGLNVHACAELSERLDEGTIVTVLPDGGVKYLSKIYNQAWRDSQGFARGAADPQSQINAERVAAVRHDVNDPLAPLARVPKPRKYDVDLSKTSSFITYALSRKARIEEARAEAECAERR